MQRYEEIYRVKVYETNQYGQITLESICNYLQEMATYHAEILGFGITLMIKQSLTWVLTRLELHMDDYPLLGEEVVVETYPSASDKYYAYRDFIIYNSKREKIGYSTTTWLLIDIKTMRPALLPEFFNKFTEDTTPLIDIDSIRKIILPKENEFVNQREFHARKSDIDINQHVNNSRFVSWANELIPLDNKKLAKTFIIEFRKECNYADIIVAKVSVLEENDVDIYTHAIYKQGVDKPVSIAQTKLVKHNMRVSSYVR